MVTPARDASSSAAAMSAGPKLGLLGARQSVMHPSTTPRAVSGTARNDA